MTSGNPIWVWQLHHTLHFIPSAINAEQNKNAHLWRRFHAVPEYIGALSRYPSAAARPKCAVPRIGLKVACSRRPQPDFSHGCRR